MEILEIFNNSAER